MTPSNRLAATKCVALIGVGTMGLPIGRNVLAAGHELVACDLDPGRVALLGVERCETPAAAAARADVILTSLPSVAAVEDAVLGERGIRAGAREGALVVEMSTGPPALARRLAEELARAGVDCLDAPVSGGPAGAESATLTIMVGGPVEAFGRAEPLLRSLGSVIVHVGGHGAGQAAKLCNNLLAGVNMAAVAEACAVAQRAGIDAQTLYALLTSSTGDSRVLRTRFPLAGVEGRHPVNDGYEPLFTLDLLVKDLELARALADELGLEPALAETALRVYRKAQAAGLGHLDYSAVFLADDIG